jgi:hypothetical protein
MHTRPMRLGPFAVLPTALAIAALVSVEVARSEPAAPPAAAEALATFESGSITRADYERVLSMKTKRELEFIAKPGGREALLDSLVNYDLLIREAERRGYDKHIEVRVAHRRAMADEMLEAEFTIDRAKLPKDEVKQVYDARKREFGRPHMRRATHIRVASEAEAKALAAELQGSEREAFARVSREKNIDPRTKNQGGELGYFTREGTTEAGRPTQVLPELVKATYALKKVGDVSPRVIAHGDGTFSVLMLTGEMAEIDKSLSELDPILREQIAMKKQGSSVDALVEKLREEHEPIVNTHLLDAIVLPPAERTDRPEGFAAAPPDPREPPMFIEPDGI